MKPIQPKPWHNIVPAPEDPTIVEQRWFRPGDRVMSTEHAPEMYRRGRQPRKGVVCQYWRNTLNCQVEWDDGIGPQTAPQKILVRDRSSS